MSQTDFNPATFARILSRAFSLYLLVWALSDLLSLPEYLPSFFHYQQMAADTVQQRSYWLTYYLIRIVVNIIRSTALLLLSRYLWKKGSFLLTFFSNDVKVSETEAKQL
jgi:cytochrome c oxidase subunit IV